MSDFPAESSLSFAPGEKVVFIPPHAGGPEHRDAERGVVRGSNERYVFVDYFDEADVSKATKREWLRRADFSTAEQPGC